MEIEQIADKVGRETDEYLSDKIAAPEEWKRIRDIEFSRRLVAELAKQEPVGYLNPYGSYLSARFLAKHGSGLEQEIFTIPLYTHPNPTPEDVRDAAKWREHEAKKKALIERGFLKSPLRDAAMTAHRRGSRWNTARNL